MEEKAHHASQLVGKTEDWMEVMTSAQKKRIIAIQNAPISRDAVILVERIAEEVRLDKRMEELKSKALKDEVAALDKRFAALMGRYPTPPKA